MATWNLDSLTFDQGYDPGKFKSSIFYNDRFWQNRHTPWVNQDTYYYVDKVVTHNGSRYVCILQHIPADNPTSQPGVGVDSASYWSETPRDTSHWAAFDTDEYVDGNHRCIKPMGMWQEACRWSYAVATGDYNYDGIPEPDTG
jgi:hypothetical protein